MKKQYLILMVLCLLVGMVGCKTKDGVDDAAVGTKTEASNSIFMRANLNGQAWEAEYVTAVQFDAGSVNHWELTVKGEDESGDDVMQFAMAQLNVGQFDVGSYPFGGPTATVAGTFLRVTPTETWLIRTDTVNTGEIVVNDIGGNRIVGTFEASLMDGLGGVLEVTDGVFESNNYTTR